MCIRDRVSETAIMEKDLFNVRRNSDKSSQCLGRLRILIWSEENVSEQSGGILLNPVEVR